MSSGFRVGLIRSFAVLLVVVTSFHCVWSKTTTFQDKIDIPDDLFNLPLSETESGTSGIRLETKSLLEPALATKSVVVKGQAQGQVCEGACITARACDYHGGTPKGFCVTGSICCKFERSCTGVSREKVSFFQSPNYPKPLNGSMECNFQLIPNEDVCAVRVDFLDFDLAKSFKTPRTEKCVTDSFYVLNTMNGANEALCEMGNYSSIFYVDPKAPKPVIIVFVMQSPEYKWQLRFTQVNCKKIIPWKNTVECGRQLMYEPPKDHNDDYNIANPIWGQMEDGIVTDDGQLSPILTPLIVNGKDAEQREFPWQVSLQISPSHRCGGSILNDRFILTAAHCVMGKAFSSLDKLRVVVGDLVLNSTQDGEHETHEVEHVIVNFHYKTFQSYVNDIAIIKTKTRIVYSPTVQPVCLPTPDVNLRNKEGLVSGWGRLNGTSASPPALHLQKLKVVLIAPEDCRERVRVEISHLIKKNVTSEETAKYAQMGVSPLQLCAIARTNSTVCFGDSGGALVVQNEDDGRYVQVGVVSYGLGQCAVNRVTPVAYTRLTEYLQFIAIATTEYT